MNYTLFGYNNPSGAFFYELIVGKSVEVWGRSKPKEVHTDFVYCDLRSDPINNVKRIKGVLVSFSPIWLLSSYLSRVSDEQPEQLKDLRGIVAISSSSYMTKQYAFSDYDKSLSARLNNAHTLLISLCTTLRINCRVLAPTLVYGEKFGFRDQNISRIIKLMRVMPIILIPKSTGSRQPIHASQLARVVHRFAEDIIRGQEDGNHPVVLPLGGDEILSYSQLLERIQESLPKHDPAKQCRLIAIPNRLFLTFCSPLLPVNTRLFEAIMRVNSNLSGFSTASSLLAEEQKRFPIQPFSY